MTGTIGIVGAGSIVERYYLTALKQLHYRDILLYDSIETRALQLAHQHGLQYADISTIQAKADTIIVATPPHTHFDLVNVLLTPNKTVICEKPFVLSQHQAMLLNIKAQQLDAQLFVGHIRRIFPAIQLAQQYIRQHQHTLGKLKQATLMEGARFNYQSQSGYVHNHPMGGVLADTGSHVLDSFLFVTGLEQQPIKCEVRSLERDQAEPAHEINCAFEVNAIPVELKLSRYETLSNKITLRYEHARIEIPLSIKPAFRVTTAHGTMVQSAADSCITYYSQAFKEELRLLIQQHDERFSAQKFINLSAILETLYNA
jgi:predicted dehydrogenase